jgi:alpha-glucuronidase
MVLTKPYLEKVAALANVFRPYGIKIYLTARFSAPIEIGGLKQRIHSIRKYKPGGN